MVATPARSSTTSDNMCDLATADGIWYLEQILTAKVYDVCKETDLHEMTRLSERIGSSILVKREDQQPVFSFKLRGAYNMIANLPQDQLDKGIITASAGNHAQGVAFSAKHVGCKAIIAMPTVTPAIKYNSVKRLGAEIVLVGENFDETKAWALEQSEKQDMIFIPPFDHPLVIAGQGTIGMEILRQCTRPIDAIFVPVGGGGLIAGIAAYVKRLRPDIKIIGVEPTGANAMYRSLREGTKVMLDKVDTFADGVAVKTTGFETLRICRELVDDVVLCDTDEICVAIKDIFEDTRSITEPSGALAVAGAKKWLADGAHSNKRVIAITSGGEEISQKTTKKILKTFPPPPMRNACKCQVLIFVESMQQI
jgi:threonine dehydratase